MYRRILIPSDGSKLSGEAVCQAIEFARQIQASVVGIHVSPLFHPDLLEAWAHHDPDYAEHRRELHEKLADEYLDFISSSALAQGVHCIVRKIAANDPSLAIVGTAEQEGCDLIYMAAHGWTAEEAQLLGGVTLKVLHQSRVPVLIHKSHARHRTARQDQSV